MNLETLAPRCVAAIGDQIKEDHYISSLDPLQADQLLTKVPELNRTKDTVGLVLMLVDLLPSMQEAVQFDYAQACAAMRDIGIMLGSLKRHGVEPVRVIPELEDKLNLLGSISNLPPRDTLIHYVRWNQVGERLRTYTGTEDERQLIASVRVAMPTLHRAIMLLDELYSSSMASPEFVPLCEAATSNFGGMVEGVVNARRRVSPKYFAEELRFYFDPIILNEREYLGPGAVEMPVFLFDHILWNCDLKDAKYMEFKQAYLPYNQEDIRELYDKYQGKPSLASKVILELDTNMGYSERIMDSAKAFNRLFNILKSFRAPHKKLADEAYEHGGQKKEERREKGSGGYDPGILHYIIKLNSEIHNRLKTSINSYSDLGFSILMNHHKKQAN